MTQARPGVSVHSAKLADYLATRRWFGGKGRAIARAALADLIPVKWPSSPTEFAVGRAEVTTDEGGGSACYQLFLDDASELPVGRRPIAGFGPMRIRGRCSAYRGSCGRQQ